MIETKFKLSGLTCGACAKIAKKRFMKGISDIETADVTETGEVTISAKDNVSRESIDNALADTDFRFESFI